MGHENGGWMNADQRDAEKDAADAIRRDAIRYRWLKQSAWKVSRYYPALFHEASVGDLDSAIDRAMRAEQQQLAK